MGSVQEKGGKKLFYGSPHPLIIELNRLEDQLRGKERELGEAYSEIKALKASEELKDKAVIELSTKINKLEEKLSTAEEHIEQKNLEAKKLNDGRKEALASQYAAEAALRRIHSSKEEEEYFPVEAIISPLESDIRKYKKEILKLGKDKKALERLTKSKEAALLEAQKILQIALERVLIVENVQSENCDLRRQVEICQDENKFLNKIYRQKVLEVEKLAQTIHELEESLLASGMAANTLREYRHQISDLSEEKKVLERELARAKVSMNRVASTVANQWKDDNEKVMPIKNWLEERRFFQGEIQRLRDKLLLSERTAKAEAQFNEKMKLRLRTLEEGLRFSSQHGGPTKKTLLNSSKSKSSITASIMQQANSTIGDTDTVGNFDTENGMETKYIIGESSVRKNSDLKCKNYDSGKQNSEEEEIPSKHKVDSKISDKQNACEELENSFLINGEKDMVSGFLYDILQKEVINLRKSLAERDGLLSAKEEEIKVLHRKVAALTKSIERKLQKARKEAINREKVPELVKSMDEKSKF
ncbi:microtubule-associated protein 70-5 [Dendrobium catenatum]|uniref:microtubule-associated protein 70-5 n=1 Tax=Dendrobium catenatum TaxID=906689 RepID=UPI0009F4EA35|nr:microtubule-associated protein 70-5 [Dendrobium catenatum]